VVVRDNGIGIDPRHHQNIFEIFRQIPGNPAPDGSRAGSNAGRGVGLGLAMVKRIMEQHGGAVSVRSEPGRGTAFVLTFAPELQRSQSPG
jgi:two-component system, chemotaxis family, sensor kinase Cph1